MRIFIGTENIAGIGTTLRDGFRKIGIKADCITFYPHPFSYQDDKCLNLQNKTKRERNLILNINFIKSIFKYDTFIFIFGCSLFYVNNKDIPILKFLNKKIVMIFCGCDIRCREEILKENHNYSACKECNEECNKNFKENRIRKIEKYIDVIISQREYSQLLNREFYHFWIPINLDKWQISNNSNDIPVIIHSPSHREIKGTKYIINAIDKLKKDGYKFEFLLLEKKSNDEIKEYLKKSDIVVDQLLLGWYGVFAIEAMATGKPVLCYLRDDLKDISPKLPIVNTSPDNIYENLKMLIENKNLRKEIGIKGRKYVEEFHDSKKVVKDILALIK